MWDEQYYPVTHYTKGGTNTFGAAVLARPEAFMKWAKDQDASIYGHTRVEYNAEDWAKECTKHVGHVRHSPKNEGFRFSCEFWTPLGALDYILKGRTNGVVDRTALLDWLKRAVAVENGNVTDKFAFNVLEIRDRGDFMFFWRSNEPMGAYQTYASAEWQEARRQKKDAYTKNPKGWSSAQSDSGAAPAHFWSRATGSDGDPWERYQWSNAAPAKPGGGWGKRDP